MADQAWQHNASQDYVGRIYYYERTNTDGTMGERVTIFRSSVDSLAVYKENGLCQNAALVTADLDVSNFSTTRVTGGQLRPGAEVMEFAFLDWDQAAEQLNILVRFPDMELHEDAPIMQTPWHLFDFDLASLTVATPHLTDPEGSFDFGMALVWADPSAADPLTWMGNVTANFAASEMHEGTPSRRYRLTGSAFEGERATGSEGTLWLDQADGHIVDAIFPAPNHPGYTDFRLRLLQVSDGGADEWDALLHAHFADCE